MTRRIIHRRFVALGDSFTEGMGDVAVHLPGGVRGWADRVAEQMSRATPGVQYANLAIRGKKLEHVLGEQLEAALELRPDLVTLCAGVNDLMHARVRMNELMGVYEQIVLRIRATGARVVLFTMCDPHMVAIFRPFRGRIALYNEFVRDIARRHGATVVDLWRLSDLEDRRMWGDDRLHLSTPGHQVVAREVLRHLDIEHQVEAPAVSTDVEGSRGRRWSWLWRHALPWVVRRMRGVSLGDGLSPRYPSLTPPVLPDLCSRAVNLEACTTADMLPSETHSPKGSAIPIRPARMASADGPIESLPRLRSGTRT